MLASVSSYVADRRLELEFLGALRSQWQGASCLKREITMRVNLGSVTVDDATRRAINKYFGKPGLATREDVRQAYIQFAEAEIETIAAGPEDDQ